ncbi:MATE family efflux transporter [Crassaminicella profunda]|uniref:MATE family efflux transporter n=1 Tax=Crassaminicella profunda TaxID=1286698 RepID=UPI001CA62CA5|nr:MATE family efflux transporter [Crassaminicella profunda]QZY56123.1 MATE family efflux transporter [Crassaminicella profunda]
MDEKREELLNDSIFKLMIKLSIPAIIGMFVIGLYSFVDAIFVGRWVGAKALAAVSVTYPLTLINNGIAVLIGIGSASVLSRAIGSKDQKKINDIMSNMGMCNIVLSLLVTFIGITFTDSLIGLTGLSGDIFILAKSYLRIIFVGSLFVNFVQSANMIIRGEGKMKEAMIIMGVGAILNIILDPIFIKVLNLGIEGAAYATVLSQIVQTIMTLVYFKKYSQLVQLKKPALKKDILPDVFSVGVSAMLMQVMSLVQQTILYKMVTIYGNDQQLVIMGITMRVMMFAFIPIWGMSQGLQPLAGINYGAKKLDRVRKSVKIFMLGSTVLCLAFWLPMELAPKFILSLFTKDQELIAYGFEYFRLGNMAFFVSGIFIMSVTFFQAIGKAGNAGLIIMLRQIALFIPFILIFAKFFGGIGVWYSLPITDITVFIVAMSLVIVEFKKMLKVKGAFVQR